jgi:LysM repeat protein
MSSYKVHAGDTMSAIAQHEHVSLQKLESANRQVKNANLIYVGERLNVPGKKDSFDHGKKPGHPAHGSLPKHEARPKDPVKREQQDLHDMKAAKAGGKKASAAETKAQKTLAGDATGEKAALSKIDGQVKSLEDQITSAGTPPTQAQLDQLVALGQKRQTTQDQFDAKLAKDKTAVRHDKKTASHFQRAYQGAHKRALKDLKPAEEHVGLKTANRFRKALGLKPLKHSLQPKGKGTDAYKVAREFLGHNISQLKYSGGLAKYLDKWPGNNVCCANFVSACLEKAGLIKPSEHNDTVRYLAGNLRNDPRWQSTSLAHAKPGDVVCFDVPGEGPYSHTVMFAGWKNGRPEFIGSNNVNSDGTQRITQEMMGYKIDAIFHYKG